MMGDYYDDKLMRNVYCYKSCGWCIVGVVIALSLSFLLSGCNTVKYVPVETIKRDTVYQSVLQRDSVYLHDSVYIKEWQNGDTVYRDRDRWHTKYVEKQVHDTLYKSKVDSIAVPYPVEKGLTWWEKKKIEFGELAMLVMAGLLCFVVIRYKIK